MENLIKFLVSILLLLIIIYIYNIYEDFSLVGKCYDKDNGNERLIDNDGNCINFCYCINGIPHKPDKCALETKLNCESCDDGKDPVNGMCKDSDGNYPSENKINSLFSSNTTTSSNKTTSSDTAISSDTSSYIVNKYIYDYDSNNGIYSITFDNNVTVDILIVGGGGGGGSETSGSAGKLKLLKDIQLDSGTYDINVGRGGYSAENGYNSSFREHLSNGGEKGKSPSRKTGLKYHYYRTGYCGDDANWFEGKVPDKTGFSANGSNINSFTNNALSGESGSIYSFLFTGFFKAKWNGYYFFYINSGDASYLWIGPYATVGYTTGNANVKNGGIHRPRWRGSGWIYLNKGEYPIRIQMGKNTNGHKLLVTFSCHQKTSGWTQNAPNYYFSMDGDYIKGQGGEGASEEELTQSDGANGLSSKDGIDFLTHFNLPKDNSLGEYIADENKVYFAGGGGGIGGKGGGGTTDASGEGINNTGGGGNISSKGGSGVVIIKYKDI